MLFGWVGLGGSGVGGGGLGIRGSSVWRTCREISGDVGTRSVGGGWGDRSLRGKFRRSVLCLGLFLGGSPRFRREWESERHSGPESGKSPQKSLREGLWSVFRSLRASVGVSTLDLEGRCQGIGASERVPEGLNPRSLTARRDPLTESG